MRHCHKELSFCFGYKLWLVENWTKRKVYRNKKVVLLFELFEKPVISYIGINKFKELSGYFKVLLQRKFCMSFTLWFLEDNVLFRYHAIF